MTSVNFATKLLKSQTLKDGSHPIVLQVIFDATKVRRIRLGVTAFDSEWDFHQGQFLSSSYGANERNQKLYNQLNRAESFASKYHPFNFKQFAQEFRNKEDSSTVLAFFDQVIEDFKKKR